MSEVVIEEATAVLKGGFIPWLKEKYPFSKLTNSTWANADKTAVKGPSFVIKHEDNPPSTLAAGRKRFKHCQYISRKENKVGDVRVWLHPESALPADKPSVAGKANKSAAKPASAPAPKTMATPAPQGAPKGIPTGNEKPAPAPVAKAAPKASPTANTKSV